MLSTETSLVVKKDAIKISTGYYTNDKWIAIKCNHDKPIARLENLFYVMVLLKILDHETVILLLNEIKLYMYIYLQTLFLLSLKKKSRENILFLLQNYNFKETNLKLLF